MTPYRINIPLTLEERQALSAAALAECRDPRDQARYLVRVGLGLAGRESAAPVTIKCDGGDLRAAVAGEVAS